MLHLGLQGLTEVDTDPKRSLVSFKVTPPNDRVLCVHALGMAPGKLSIERFFEGLQNHMEKKMREMKTK